VLTLTHEAAKAIETLTDQLTDGTGGLRISAQPSDDGTASLALALADAPLPDDQVVESEGASVYLAEPVVAFMDDKTLDAELRDEGVAFSVSGP
jgi:iron-sulfur cluster assembly protein